jgi:hypothetical protein
MRVRGFAAVYASAGEVSAAALPRASFSTSRRSIMAFPPKFLLGET